MHARFRLTASRWVRLPQIRAVVMSEDFSLSPALILADLQTLDKALPRLVRETKFNKDPERAGGGYRGGHRDLVAFTP
jgi:hypothetical protein